MPHRYFSKEFAQGMAWLSEADSRHLCVVMRAQAGQTVTVCDGHGTDYACRLAVDVYKRQAQGGAQKRRGQFLSHPYTTPFFCVPAGPGRARPGSGPILVLSLIHI